MSTEIMIALISSGSSLVVAAVSIFTNNRILGFKVDELAKKVEKHNNLIERTAVIERDMKTAFNRIDETRQEVKEIRGK